MPVQVGLGAGAQAGQLGNASGGHIVQVPGVPAQRLPHIVRGFFRDPNLRYITAE
jgi:hypothetical protein